MLLAGKGVKSWARSGDANGLEEQGKNSKPTFLQLSVTIKVAAVNTLETSSLFDSMNLIQYY